MEGRFKRKHITQLKKSEVYYSEVVDGTDIKYGVLPGKLKESIIINNKNKLRTSYEYEITAPNLTATLLDDKSIKFSTLDSQETIFVIAAPYMFDSAEEPIYPLDIEVTLKNKAEGTYVIEYRPDLNWMRSENRVFPIIIDPTVTVDASIQSTYMGKPLRKFSLPGLPKDAIITKADYVMPLTQISENMNNSYVETYKYIHGSTTLGRLEDRQSLDAATVGGEYHLDVTKAVYDWYENSYLSSNTGLVINQEGSFTMDDGYLQIQY